MDFANVRNPQLKLTVTSPRSAWQLFPAAASSITATGKLQASIDGPLHSAAMTGATEITSLNLPRVPDVAPLWPGAPLEAPRLVGIPVGIWSGWHLNFTVRSSQAPTLNLPGAIANIEAQLSGTVAQPVLSGHVQFAGLPGRIGPRSVAIAQADFDFSAGRPRDPSLTLRALGSAYDQPFTVHAAGPLSHLVRFIETEPPLSEDLVRAELSGNGLPVTFMLLAPVAQAAAIEVFAWAPVNVAAPAAATEPQ